MLSPARPAPGLPMPKESRSSASSEVWEMLAVSYVMFQAYLFLRQKLVVQGSGVSEGGASPPVEQIIGSIFHVIFLRFLVSA